MKYFEIKNLEMFISQSSFLIFLYKESYIVWFLPFVTSKNPYLNFYWDND